MTQKSLTDFESSGVECPKCDYSSKDKRGVAVHWRHNHSGMLPWMETQCDYCGETFKKQESERKQSKNDFCSRECNNKWLSENRTGENSNFWRGGKVTIQCDNCGSDVKRKPSHVQEHTFCDHDCLGEWQESNYSGDGNPAWNGGHDFYTAIRTLIDGEVWPEAREKCRERHNRKCAVCGVEESELDRKLDVHHIVPLLSGGTNGQYNLVPLCAECHGPVESYTREIIDYEFKQHGGRNGKS